MKLSFLHRKKVTNVLSFVNPTARLFPYNTLMPILIFPHPSYLIPSIVAALTPCAAAAATTGGAHG
jgi:hypothetical protein